MRELSSIAAMTAWSETVRVGGERVVFVPTMGALHAGHTALMDVARSLADRLVVSIFVNPAQFGPGEDFSRYPRTLESDRAACEAHGVDLLFTPAAAEIYPPGHSIYVLEESLSRFLCGRHRPGHFRGVLTVVTQLFNLVRPHVAVFGQKDAQQARLIQQLVRDLHMGVDVRVAPTVREADGLAMSSRNRYLDAPARIRARCLSEALALGRTLFEGGARDAQAVCRRLEAHCLDGEPAVSIEYVEAVDLERLEPVQTLAEGTLLALCVRVGGARLIDNCILGRERVASRYGLLPESPALKPDDA